MASLMDLFRGREGRVDERREIAAGRIRGDPVLQAIAAAATNVPGGIEESQFQESVLGPITEGSATQREVASENLLSIAEPAQQERQQRRLGELPLTTAQQAQLSEQARATDQTNMRLTTEATNKARIAETTAVNKAADTLGDDLRKSMIIPREVMRSRAQVRDLLATGSALGGAVAVVALARAADPGSTVREAEAGRIEGGVGAVLALQNAWNRIVADGVTEQTVAEFNAVADALAGKVALEGLTQMAGFVGELAEQGITGDRMRNLFRTAGIDPNELLAVALPSFDDETAGEIAALHAQGVDVFDMLSIF